MTRMTRTTSKVSVFAVVLVPLVMGSSVSDAAVPVAETARPDAGRDGRLATLVRQGERAHELSLQGVSGAFLAVTESIGTSAVAAPVVPAVVPGLPEPLQGPVGRLLAAIEVSGQVILDELPVERSRLGEVHARIMERGFLTSDTFLDQAFAKHPGGVRPSNFDDTGYLQALAVAGATVTDAIESTLPLLQEVSITTHRGSTDGCDVFDQPLVLCIAGEGPNVLTDDYALVIDLGGDDIHRHSAGGADLFVNGLPVSVTIDLDGNDRYESDGLPGVSPVVQGGGLFGLGVLVDVAGNDSYTAATTYPYRSVGAQGAGVFGAGIFADLGGNDRYEVSSTSLGNTGAVGQGFGAFGYGVALDADGDDEYRMVSRSELTTYGQMLDPGNANALGFGTGITGVFSEHPGFTIEIGGRGGGLFADLDGADSFEVEATTGTIPPDDITSVLWRAATSMVFGVGEGLGVGLSLSGPGDTTRSVTTSVRTPQGRAWTSAFGAGMTFATGILSDRGGDDAYAMDTSVVVERRSVIDDECDCTAAAASAEAGRLHAMGMGFGSSFGGGLLHDAAGDDTYLASGITRSAAEARDLRTPEDRVEPASLDAGAVSDRAAVSVQGAGITNGSGTLLDEAGDDRYEVRLINIATAGADQDDAATAVATSRSGDAVVAAQGGADAFGYGALMDLDGRDQYSVFAEAPAQAFPPTSVVPGAATAYAQAASSLGAAAGFLDRDGGAENSFQMTPPAPVCVGTRGEDTWVDCNGAIGVSA